jgi:hypothetical protein
MSHVVVHVVRSAAVHSRTVACIAGLLAVATTSVASAQTGQRFGSSGQLVLSGERLFGVAASTATSEQMGTEVDVSTTTIDIGVRQSQSPWSSPRIALDGFVTDGLSLGGGLGFSTFSLSTGATMNGTSADIDLASGWTFVVAPRVGYAYMFDGTVGIWPRAGLSLFFGSATLETNVLDGQDLDGDGMPDVMVSAPEVSLHGIALTAELPLVITPAEHFAILIAPTLDFGVSGGASTDEAGAGTSTEQDITITDLGVQIGLAGWF